MLCANLVAYLQTQRDREAECWTPFKNDFSNETNVSRNAPDAEIAHTQKNGICSKKS